MRDDAGRTIPRWQLQRIPREITLDSHGVEFEMRFCEQCHATVIHDFRDGKWS